MNYAQEIARIFIPVAFAWGMTYLLGSFVSASWNLTEWEPKARIVCAIWGSVFGAVIWNKLRAMP
jgi:hypothetical protein